MSFQDIALPMAMQGIPVTPVLPNSKKAFLPDFPSTATTDAIKILEWDALYPNHNCGCVARNQIGCVWFFEIDSMDVVDRIEKETGHTLPDTFRVRSRRGRGHLYFRQNSASIAMGNLSQSYVKFQDWSARVDNQYVIAPGSIHPDTNEPYTVTGNFPIIEAPEWLIYWCLQQRIKSKAEEKDPTPRNEAGKVPHGSIHGWLLTQAGKLRANGMVQEEIEPVLLRLAHEQCQEPLDDEKIKTMAKSICIYPAGTSSELLLSAQAPTTITQVEPEPLARLDYPVFPRWVMEGTSIYDNFVKPYCDKNSRIPEFMWLPAAVIMMNYFGNKVTVWGKEVYTNFYVLMIGEAGRTNKSSSVKDALRYLQFAGITQYAGRDTKNAEGKTLVWSAGSPEGLGIDMERTNCKNAILFYDELSQLVSKANIDCSSLNSALLTMYESSWFSNTIKARKDAFAMPPGSYTASVIACTTDAKFDDLWSRLAGRDTGLDDRFFFLLQPEKLEKIIPMQRIDFAPGALKTRQIIDAAVQRGTFNFVDTSPLEEIAEKHGNRTELRAEKWALYFAIDQGFDEINEYCVDRAVAITKYEIETKQYLQMFEARNEESQIQQLVMKHLRMNGGKMPKRALEKKIHPSRYGTSRWNIAYGSMIKYGYIREVGDGTRSNSIYVEYLRPIDGGDEVENG